MNSLPSIVNVVNKVQRQFTLDRLLALIAIVAGIVAIVYESELKRDFRIQQVTVKEIVSSVTTRYVARFPDNLENATNLISQAKSGDEVLILVDFLGYGHYSDPERYLQYVNAIKNARQKAHVRIMIYDEQAAKADLQAQFSRADYENIISNLPTVGASDDRPISFYSDDSQERQKRQIRLFLHYLKYYQKPRPTGYEDFLNTVASTQDHFCRQLASEDNVEVASIAESSNPEVQAHEVVFFWVLRHKEQDKEQDKEMIFSFPNLADTAKGVSFKTSDDRLIEIFVRQFEQKWQARKPIQYHCYASEKPFSPHTAQTDNTKK